MVYLIRKKFGLIRTLHTVLDYLVLFFFPSDFLDGELVIIQLYSVPSGASAYLVSLRHVVDVLFN